MRRVSSIVAFLVVSACGGGGVGTTLDNRAPVADAGADQYVSTGALVTLDGSTSNDADGDLLVYRWSFTARPPGSAALLADVTSARPTFTADRDGAYAISLVVNDGTVDSSSDSVTVIATTGNTAPIANAGPDQNVMTGTRVTLDASASSDANGDLLAYSWAFTARPAESTAELSNTTAVKPTFTADRDGIYVIELVVDDGNVSSDPDAVTITAATVNSAPVANAGIDQNVVTGAQVTLDGRASSDADGDLLTYAWSITAKPGGSAAALSSTTAVMPTFIADREGTYVFSLVVYDGALYSGADSVVVTAATANSVPVANAGPDLEVSTGMQITLDGRASSDADGDVLSYTWSVTAKPEGSNSALSSTSGAMPMITPDRDGTYVISLVVSDGLASSVPDSMTITATTPNSVPVAIAGLDQYVTTGSLVTLDGRASNDYEPGILTYAWSFTSKPEGSEATLSNATSVTPTFTADRDGVYVIRLVVSDGIDVSAPDSVTVTASSTSGGCVFQQDALPGTGVAILPDGRIVAVATLGMIASELLRFNGDASGGVRIALLSGVAEDVTVQPDGKILVVGKRESASQYGSDVMLLRFDSEGKPDPSFGANGTVIFDGPAPEEAGRVAAVQPDGKIVVSASAYDYSTEHTLLLRFNSDGTLDDSFGTGGVQAIDYGGQDIALQPDGKIVATGTFQDATQDLVIVRYNSDGSLDTRFGSDGLVRYNGGDWAVGDGVAVQPDGRIVVVGGRSIAGVGNVLLLRYESDGTPDVTFGSHGAATARVGLGNDVAVQPDGKIVIAGYTVQQGILYEVALVARYTADGRVDASFGADGAFTFNGPNGADFAVNVALAEDGGIVAVGASNYVYVWGAHGNLLLMRLFDRCE